MGGGIGQGDGPAHVVRLESCRFPLRRGDGGGEAGLHASSRAGGEEPASPRPTCPPTQWSTPPASFATTNSVGPLSPPSGPGQISPTRPAEWSGRDDTPRLVGRPSPTGGERFAERGVALIRAFCGAITRDGNSDSTF
ncbi:hypothetical protein GWK47_042199 [Chionoecetes opilio]|uniref:Uncharacterized protein n=1 Tax=Chionoecetes opilio TaxID=41210 RepID=A0A8J4Y9B5_CHIOP|nr:hypothetical protein GWK47_042199 [Chionoecetes opilio]